MFLLRSLLSNGIALYNNYLTDWEVSAPMIEVWDVASGGWQPAVGIHVMLGMELALRSVLPAWVSSDV